MAGLACSRFYAHCQASLHQYAHTRWEGRPKTPPFSWSDEAGGERVLPHDAWLAALDLSQEGAGALQEPEFLATDPAAGASDLARVKEVLVHNAGEPGTRLCGQRADGAGRLVMFLRD